MKYALFARAVLASLAVCVAGAASAAISLSSITDQAGDIAYVRKVAGASGYIVTDVQLTSEDTLEVVFKVDDIANRKTAAGVFGTRKAADENNIAVIYSTAGVMLDFNNSDYQPYRCTAPLDTVSNRWLVATVSKSARQVRDFHTGELLAENTTLCPDVFTAGGTTTGTAAFFTSRHSKLSRGCPLIRSVRVIRDGMVRSSWMAYRDASGTAGFKDSVSGTFLTSADYKDGTADDLEFGDRLPVADRYGRLTQTLALTTETSCTITGVATPSVYVDKFDSVHTTLDSNAKDAIDLGFTAKTNYITELRFKLLEKPTKTAGVFGYRYSVSYRNYSIGLDSTGYIFADFNDCFNSGTSETYETYRVKSGIATVGHVYTVTVSRKLRKVVDETTGESWVNDTVYPYAITFSTQADTNLSLFKITNQTSGWKSPSIAVEYLKIRQEEDDGSLTELRDFRPVKKDGVAGLYDMSGRMIAYGWDPFLTNAAADPAYTCGDFSPDYPAPILKTFGSAYTTGEHTLQMEGLSSGLLYSVCYTATNETESAREPTTEFLDVQVPSAGLVIMFR